MLDKCKALAEQYDMLTAQLHAPETYTDPALFSRLAREQKALGPMAEAYRRHLTLEADLAAARELGLSQAECGDIADKLEQSLETLKRLLLPRDPDDGRSAVVELRAGTGGEEAALFAADLFRMYAAYAEQRGWRLDIAGGNATELGGWKELVFTVEGEGVWGRLKYEAGAHCVKRVPVTESGGRIQTSTATVAVLPEAEETEVVIDPKDLRIDAFRASGAGGQKVNKTSSAIRVTHLPSGMVVECQDERSQLQNKERALKILRSRLYEQQRAEQTAGVAARRRSQVGSGERSEKIRTYFFLRGQVVEQRLTQGREFHLDAVLAGELDPIIDALILAEQTEKLKSNEN